MNMNRCWREYQGWRYEDGFALYIRWNWLTHTKNFSINLEICKKNDDGDLHFRMAEIWQTKKIGRLFYRTVRLELFGKFRRKFFFLKKKSNFWGFFEIQDANEELYKQQKKLLFFKIRTIKKKRWKPNFFF